MCLDTYDQSEKRPKVLPCGHSYCSICVDDLVKEYSLTCPKCRARYAVSDASQFPFAYDLEEVLSKMRMIPTVTTTAKTRPKSGRGISRKLNSLREEQENTILNSTSDCEETLSQLHGYNNDLGEWVADHEELINKLLYMINLHKKAQQLLEKEQDRVMELHQAGKQQQQVLRMAEDSLVAARTAKEVVTAIDRADRYHLAAEEWIQKCQSLFPDTDTVHMSIKVRAATREALELMMQEANREQTGSSIVPQGDKDAIMHIPGASTTTKAVSGNTSVPMQIADDNEASCMDLVDSTYSSPKHSLCGSIHSPVPEPTSTIQHKVNHIKKTATRVLRAESLQTDRHVKALLNLGEVYAVQEHQGSLRSAKITIRQGMIYLHHLQPCPPPAHAYTLPHNKVIGLLDPSSTLAFLDLAWPGMPSQRLHIRMGANNLWSTQFVLLCTGEWGPTYVNTKILEVERKDKPGECLVGGDYENNNGSGGSSIMSELERDGHSWLPDTTGAVVARWGNDNHRGAQFGIRTRDYTVLTVPTAIGFVESGLDILKAAVSLPDISSVTIVDCGVVIPR